MAKFIKIKSVISKLKQSELIEELALSTSNFQRYRGEKKMHSPYRILQSSNINTRKQKMSKHTEQDLRMISNDLKLTSKHFKMTANELVEIMRIKLEVGDLSNIHISGKDRIEQAFSSN